MNKKAYKKATRKFNIMLALIMVFCGYIVSPFISNEPLFVELSTNASAAEHTADDAINWVRSNVNKTIDVDGAFGGQCVDLIDAYFEYLGYNWRNYLVNGACDFSYKSMPSDWSRIKGAQPQKGDVLIYSASNSNLAGHVAIYESDYVTYHQNLNGNQFVQKITSIRYDGVSNPYWGVLRPNFQPPIPPPSPVSVSSGKYKLVNVGSGRYMNYDYGSAYGNICEADADGSPEQTFKINSCNDNKYSLQILHNDGGYVNSNTDGVAVNGTTITKWNSVSDDTQKFYFYKSGDYYYIASATDRRLVFTSPNSNLSVLSYRYYDPSNNYQKWKIVRIDDLPSPDAVFDGDYQFVNVGSGRYMNYDYGSAYGNICEAYSDGSPEQNFRVSRLPDNKYVIQILHNDGGYVNSNTDGVAVNGTTITKWNSVSDDTQKFYFYKSGDYYYIAGATDRSLVFTSPDSNLSVLSYRYYDPSNNYQKWKIVPVTSDPITTTAKPVTTTTTSKTTTSITTTVTTTSEPLSIEKTSLTMNIGEMSKIIANQSNLTYRSSNDNVALVSKTGVITAVANGKAVITVSNADKDAATITVVVNDTVSIKGDANCDNTMNMSDAVLVMQSLANPSKYGIYGTDSSHITIQGTINADIDGNGLTNADALEIQKILLGVIK